MRTSFRQHHSSMRCTEQQCCEVSNPLHLAPGAKARKKLLPILDGPRTIGTMYGYIVFDGFSKYGRYQVADVTYAGRPARVLYSDGGDAAQSGIAFDDSTEPLFDYNQRFIELLRGLRPKNILLLGGGAFTLPAALQREMPSAKIDVVELDSMLLVVAMTYFNFIPAAQTQIYLGDGIEYLKHATTRYDAIIVDVFEHATVPRAFQTARIAQQYQRLLSPHGLVAINVIGHYHTRLVSPVLRRQISAFRTAFYDVQIFPASQYISFWLPQNFIIVGQHLPREMPWIRSQPVSTPLHLSG